MDFQFSSLDEVKSFEKLISEFFLSCAYALRESDAGKSQKWENREVELHTTFLNAQKDVDRAFRRNFNFKEAFFAVKNLIHSTNSYLKGDSSP